MSAKWDSRFLDMAALAATWSKDPSTQVGAVIVDQNKRVVSLGFNGFPQGCDDHGDALENRELKLLRTIHAEDNAILFAQRDITGMTIYVTHAPCARCAAKIVQSGACRVVHPDLPTVFAARWRDDLLAAYDMFREAGVLVTVLNEGGHQ